MVQALPFCNRALHSIEPRWRRVFQVQGVSTSKGYRQSNKRKQTSKQVNGSWFTVRNQTDEPKSNPVGGYSDCDDSLAKTQAHPWPWQLKGCSGIGSSSPRHSLRTRGQVQIRMR